MARRWKILTVATVAIAVARENGNRWTSAKRAAEKGDERYGTAYQVWYLLTQDPAKAKAIKRPADLAAAREALEGLRDRSNLTRADEALRGLLIDLGRAGGVPAEEIGKVAMVAAFYYNGQRRRYPQKDLWASMQGGPHVGTPGSRVSVEDYATVTHVLPLDPVRMGGKSKPATLRDRILYKVKADNGACFQWVEQERSHLRFRKLKKGERLILRSGKVKLHTETEGVRFTEFYPNDVDLLVTK